MRPQAELAKCVLVFHTVLLDDFWRLKSAAKIRNSVGRRVELPEAIKGEKMRLTLVLLNLLRNAIKFTILGTVRVLVAFDAGKGMLFVHVQDSGRGISIENQQGIFALGMTLPESQQLNRDGLGMGLHICKTICEKNGGYI